MANSYHMKADVNLSTICYRQHYSEYRASYLQISVAPFVLHLFVSNCGYTNGAMCTDNKITTGDECQHVMGL